MSTSARSSPPMASRRYHHGHLRRALLDATVRLAGERGAAAVTLREAARTAGVSQTAPYRHFRDQQAMLAAASAEGFALLAGQMGKATVVPHTDPLERLIAQGLAYVSFARRHPSHFHLMFGHGSPAKATSPGLQRAAREVFQSVLATIVA